MKLFPILTILAFMVCFGDARSFSDSERALILLHHHSKALAQEDDSNRASANSHARALGYVLFREPRLSSDSTMACVSCHNPAAWFMDGRAQAKGREMLNRNTPSVVDAAYHRWFGWGGAHDSLWSASISGLVAPNEMAGDAEHVARFIKSDPKLVCAMQSAFDVRLDELSAQAVLVLVGKSLAAYQRYLTSGPSLFDGLTSALQSGDSNAVEAYPQDAMAGLKLFVGKGRCSLCHAGPHFSNGEFADAGVPYFTKDGVDKGRFDDLKKLRNSPFNRLGQYADSTGSERAKLTRFATRGPEQFGAFRVPGLRNVAKTAPYMHDGSLSTLDDVINHYSNLSLERLHDSRAQLLRPLNLSAAEHAELKAFLKTLTGEPARDPDLGALLASCSGSG